MGELTSAQFSEWEAHDRLDPIGRWREDFHMAMLASVITNTAIGFSGAKGVELTRPYDFMPKWDAIEDEQTEGQTVEEMKKVFEHIAQVQNKKAKRSGTQSKQPANKKKE